MKGASNPERLCRERWCREILGTAELSERSKYVETIPHVEKLSICHIDNNLCTWSSCAVPCELLERSKCVKSKMFNFGIHLPRLRNTYVIKYHALMN